MTLQRVARLRRLTAIATMLVVTAGYALAQSNSCPAVPPRPDTQANTAYAAAKYSEAEGFYRQAVSQQPQSVELAVDLVNTWLHENEVSQAAATVTRMLASSPRSAPLLTASADVQYRQGQPWLTLQTLDTVASIDPCYARAHLVRARVFRIDSMYASERAEIQKAYSIDPTDPDIRRAFINIVTPANDILNIYKALVNERGIEPEVKAKAEASAASMLPLLSENSQTCKILPADPAATLPLLPLMPDGRHVDAYRLEVQFPQTKAQLQLDTAASGLYISRSLADANGLQQAAGDPPGTVHADSVRIGSLEFRDCMVGVSDTPFPGKIDGLISTDIFASYLITVDQPRSKLILAPLPPQPGQIPGDRSQAPELHDYSPVYHRLQYLLVPVLVNGKERRLFVLDSGIRLSTMTADTAHAVSNTKVNFTNPIQTTSGATLQIFRDSFDFEFANMFLRHQARILEFDASAMEQNTGFALGGMVGFDILHSMILHLDYRDGLVKFESSDAAVSSVHGPSGGAAGGLSAQTAPTTLCQHDEDDDRPLSDTLEVKVNGLLDSAHLKPGHQIFVPALRGWEGGGCKLLEDANVYGHVTAAVSSKTGTPELSLVFDHADCYAHPNKPLSFRVLGVIAPPDAFKGIQAVAPVEVAGGTRNATTGIGTNDLADEINLNPNGPPHTVHPGVTAGFAKLKLEPEGGPACSAKLSGEDNSIKLGIGAELLLEIATPAGDTP